MSRLVKLEKILERGLDRLRRPEGARELIEAIPDVLDDVEDHLEPSGGRGRVFPYERVLVAFRVDSAAAKTAAKAQVAGVPDRIRERLRMRGCEPPEDLAIEVRCVTVRGDAWGERTFKVHYRRRREGAEKVAPRPAPPVEPLPVLRLNVLRGRTAEKEHELSLARINLGRLEKVASANGRARKNHVWFAAGEDTVSRAHARIERVGREYFLYDEGSASGTRVIRAGGEVDLMPRASRGVKLQNGDRIELGKGCVVEVAIRV